MLFQCEKALKSCPADILGKVADAVAKLRDADVSRNENK